MTHYHLAQVNIGRVRAPLEDLIMEGFRTQLDPINALADSSPGFVWRLQTEDGNAMAIRPYADEHTAINMSGIHVPSPVSIAGWKVRRGRGAGCRLLRVGHMTRPRDAPGLTARTRRPPR
jgi:hypothetical protein